MRGAALRPIPDSWFPFFERHYAIGESDGIQLKVTGSRQHTGLFFDFMIKNVSTSDVRLCEECVTLDTLDHVNKTPVPLVWGKKPKYVGEYYFDHGFFIIPARSASLIQGHSRFSGPKPLTIRIDMILNRANGQANKFSFNFEVPGN